jgi:hypothetical protein
MSLQTLQDYVMFRSCALHDLVVFTADLIFAAAIEEPQQFACMYAYADK